MQSWAVFEILVIEIRISNTFCILYFVFEILTLEYFVFCILVFKLHFSIESILKILCSKYFFQNTFHFTESQNSRKFVQQ